MTKQVDTFKWLAEEPEKILEAVQKAGIDVKNDEFLTMTQLADGYVFVFGALEQDGARTMVEKLIPGLVMPALDVLPDIYAPDEEGEDDD